MERRYVVGVFFRRLSTFLGITGGQEKESLGFRLTIKTKGLWLFLLFESLRKTRPGCSPALQNTAFGKLRVPSSEGMHDQEKVGTNLEPLGLLKVIFYFYPFSGAF